MYSQYVKPIATKLGERRTCISKRFQQLAIKDLLCNFESGLGKSTGVVQRALFGGNNYIFKVKAGGATIRPPIAAGSRCTIVASKIGQLTASMSLILPNNSHL